MTSVDGQVDAADVAAARRVAARVLANPRSSEAAKAAAQRIADSADTAIAAAIADEIPVDLYDVDAEEGLDIDDVEDSDSEEVPPPPTVVTPDSTVVVPHTSPPRRVKIVDLANTSLKAVPQGTVSLGRFTRRRMATRHAARAQAAARKQRLEAYGKTPPFKGHSDFTNSAMLLLEARHKATGKLLHVSAKTFRINGARYRMTDHKKLIAADDLQIVGKKSVGQILIEPYRR